MLYVRHINVDFVSAFTNLNRSINKPLFKEVIVSLLKDYLNKSDNCEQMILMPLLTNFHIRQSESTTAIFTLS